ncbi:uncharacterized protein LOC135085190 [Ostrinia nubilalis]|uniref:uncharacterized protein LOC135085190 n=1 Tax=Ostrinia nubilalis TaxID=29057 RepID=UPI003082291A
MPAPSPLPARCPLPPRCRAAVFENRVPGIELAPPARAPPAEPPPPEPVPDPPQPIDISSWDETTPVPSTSQESEPKKSVAKICGQNICLDDSILKRNVDTTDSDEEFFSELDRATGSVERLHIDNNYKQTVMVADEVATAADNQSDRQATNITVIQVSNKPPHTAIPVLGPETDIFDFNFTQNPENNTETSFVNIVNTEVNVNSENGYGTVFTDDYGHLSLTTTVNLTDVNDSSTDKNGVYERLCLASTSNEAVTKLKKLDRVRKSSLPNLETSNCDTTYEYLYPSQSQNQNTNTAVTVNGETQNQNGRVEVNSTQNGRVEVNSDSNGRVEVNSNVDRIQSAVTVAGNVSFNTRAARSNVERSHSQNAYDSPRRDSVRRVNNLSPKREGSNDRDNSEAAKPIWRRGLTELSLLTRLRSLARKNSPPPHDRSGAAPTKVVRRSRPEARPDAARRRSSSLSNGK